MGSARGEGRVVGGLAQPARARGPRGLLQGRTPPLLLLSWSRWIVCHILISRVTGAEILPPPPTA